MNYKIFKEIMQEKIDSCLSDYFKKDTKTRVLTLSADTDGLTVKMPDKDFSPVIILNDLYSEYKQSNDLKAITDKAVGVFVKAATAY